MNAMTAGNWHEANQRYLMAALAAVRANFEPPTEPVPAPNPDEFTADAPPALEALCSIFGLSSFERAILLLCAGMELDGKVPVTRPPTFALALAGLPEAHWSALSPARPLRRWRLIEIGTGSTLTTSPLRIDERILHYLTGLQYLDERIADLVRPLSVTADPLPSQADLARDVGAALGRVQLCGSDTGAKEVVATAACAHLGLNLFSLSVQFLPASAAELDALARLWTRDAALTGSALFVDCNEAEPTPALRRFLDAVGSPLILGSRERLNGLSRPVVTFDVPGLTTGEQRAIWLETLGERAAGLNGELDELIAQFNLSANQIRSACLDARPLWDACRAHARPGLDELAQRIEPTAGWNDLVLPVAQLEMLREIVSQVRQRATVYHEWGFAQHGTRGLGISALFAGVSGTGKTLAAEVLAKELRLDLYRIDLSQVVSKYIGETEKNLRRVFDAAEAGGVILLFDEADALFGKRSEVKDSHDRYANVEISYLLQRMEAYRGLAILTTNQKQALDPAFLRRLRFVVQFPFPDAADRARIWQRVLPSATPTENLDVNRLARLNVTGGNIRNIALNAAFLAADADEPVRMNHLLRAARSEYAKLERPLTDAEIGGWT